ncbi:MAG: DUF1588 domain-containing protein [Lentisphaerales bacterium]|nr:DUF1588 domain-containing protein [Lentisphaerales bacterium]
MTSIFHWTASFTVMLLQFTTWGDMQRNVTLAKAQLKPFIEKHCISCHGQDKQKGDFSFEDLSFSIKTNMQAQAWQDVLDTLNAGEMPPKKKKQPALKELSLVLRDLTEGLKKARIQLADQGRAITMRRLNKDEYASAIESLLHLRVDLNSLPDDDSHGAYDTIGSNQFFSSQHFESYFNLAKQLIKISLEPRRQYGIQTYQPEKWSRHKLKELLAKDRQKWNQLQAKGWQQAGFVDEHTALRFKDDFSKTKEKFESYLNLPQAESRQYIRLDGNSFMNLARVGIGHRLDKRGEYEIIITAGLHGDAPERRRYLDLKIADEKLTSFKVEGTLQKPTGHVLKYQPMLGKYINIFLHEKGNYKVHVPSYLKKWDPQNPARLWVDKVEIKGPYFKGLNTLEKLLFKEGRQRYELTPEKLRQIFTDFAYQACRQKQPDSAFIEYLIKLYGVKKAELKRWDLALIEPLALILSSPSFLYWSESSQAYPGKQKLAGRQMAVRLANFLWRGALPDPRLYELGDSGRIFNSTVLQSQVERLLTDRRSKAFSDGFFSQWLHLEKLADLSIDLKKFMDYDEGLYQSIRREPLELFYYLLKNDLSINHLIDSDFVIIDQVLARHYDLPLRKGNGFQKVNLPKTSSRGGLLTTAAFLTMTSTGDRTSPILRGAMIMEKFLNDPPAPPPPNVPELTEASVKPLAIRKMIEMHQEKAQCASCHEKIDPIGFGLENFDAIGRWRNEEVITKKKSVPVKSAGRLPTGENFDDLKSFKESLLANKDKLARSILEGLYSYGLGRNLSFSDQTDIENMLTQWRSKDYRTRSLLHIFVQSKAFQHK